MRFKKVKGFTFDEASHTYQLDGHLLTGVTTVLGVRNKEFLMWWTVKLMYETLLPKLGDVQGITKTKWEEILLEAKKAHTVRKKDALESGKIAHDVIEKYIKDKIQGFKTPMLVPIEDERAKASFEAFKAWEGANNVEWLASEVKLCDKETSIAGTVDAVANINGITTVLDFKTSNQISEDVALQTAAYEFLVHKNCDDPERKLQRAVLRIPKDGQDFEYQRIDTDYEFDLKTFLSMREVHRWNLYIKNRFTKDNKVKLQND